MLPSVEQKLRKPKLRQDQTLNTQVSQALRLNYPQNAGKKAVRPLGHG